MLKEEFEELIKREVNENQYKNIETAYEALPEYMDKMYLASAISNDIGKAINVLSFLGSHISELMGSIIIERQKVESCAYDLINKSHEESEEKWCMYGWFGCISPETKEVRLNIIKDIIKELE